MALTRLPGSKWWIETDDVTFEITGTYNKAAINADITAIAATLALPKYPIPSEVDADLALLLNAVATNAQLTTARKERMTKMLNAMYSAYMGGDPLYVEAAALIARLEGLIALRDRLV